MKLLSNMLLEATIIHYAELGNDTAMWCVEVRALYSPDLRAEGPLAGEFPQLLAARTSCGWMLPAE